MTLDQDLMYNLDLDVEPSLRQVHTSMRLTYIYFFIAVTQGSHD